MDDLLREFLTETSESLDTVDDQLVKFEQDPNNAKILDNIFRLVHTIKGTCGFLGLPRLEALAHAGETLMGKFRDGMPVTGDAVTLILSIDRPHQGNSRRARSDRSRARRQRPRSDRQLERMVERGMAAHGRQPLRASAAVPSARARQPGRPDPGAAAASRRSLARRTRARLPRDRDRGRAGAAVAEQARAVEVPKPAPRTPSRSRALNGDDAGARATRSPTSRSASTSTRSNI